MVDERLDSELRVRLDLAPWPSDTDVGRAVLRAVGRPVPTGLPTAEAIWLRMFANESFFNPAAEAAELMLPKVPSNPTRLWSLLGVNAERPIAPQIEARASAFRRSLPGAHGAYRPSARVADVDMDIDLIPDDPLS